VSRVETTRNSRCGWLSEPVLGDCSLDRLASRAAAQLFRLDPKTVVEDQTNGGAEGRPDLSSRPARSRVIPDR
jgi:hypothetical protein